MTSINAFWVCFGCVEFIIYLRDVELVFFVSVVLCLQSADNLFAQRMSQLESNPDFGFRPYFRTQINGFAEPFAERKTNPKSEVTQCLLISLQSAAQG